MNTNLPKNDFTNDDIHKVCAFTGAKATGGWTKEQDELLHDEVKRVRQSGAALRQAFQIVARKTGRKPDSVRNYYYLRIKDSEFYKDLGKNTGAFVPFSRDEAKELLRTILTAKAGGMSVRACTLSMGENDTSKMLRYQNKYRAIIRNEPQLVEEVICELKETGINAENPIVAVKTSRVGRLPKKNRGMFSENAVNIIDRLSEVEGLDVAALFEALGALASAAVSNTQSSDEIEENQFLKERIIGLEGELISQKDRFALLLMLFRRLMSINRDFLKQTSIARASSLSSYVRELSGNVDACERLITQYGS